MTNYTKEQYSKAAEFESHRGEPGFDTVSKQAANWIAEPIRNGCLEEAAQRCEAMAAAMKASPSRANPTTNANKSH